MSKHFSIQIDVEGEALPDSASHVAELQAAGFAVHRAVVVEHSSGVPAAVVNLLATVEEKVRELVKPAAKPAAPAPAAPAPAKASGGPGGFGDL